MFTVYAIRSKSTGKLYIGQTINIDKRIQRHNDRSFDKHSYTKLNGSDWILVYTEEFNTRSEVIQREKELKSYRGREYIKQQMRVGSSTVEQ